MDSSQFLQKLVDNGIEFSVTNLRGFGVRVCLNNTRNMKYQIKSVGTVPEGMDWVVEQVSKFHPEVMEI